MSYANNVWQALDGETAKNKQALDNARRLGYSRKPVMSSRKQKRVTRLFMLYLKGI